MEWMWAILISMTVVNEKVAPDLSISKYQNLIPTNNNENIENTIVYVGVNEQ